MRKFLGLVLLVLVGCESEPPPPRTVVVYAPSQLAENVDSFLTTRGFDVVMVAGESLELTSRVVDKTDSPRADVIVVDSVADAWRAGDRGALRPLLASSREGVRQQLKDPDGSWVSIGFRPALVMFRPDATVPETLSYEDLGSSDYAGKLCLISSGQPLSRAVIGMLIDQLGERPAERVVRRWVRNLAQPPFENLSDLGQAFGSGDCEVALVSTGSWAPSARIVVPSPLFFNVYAAGVSRHAEYPDVAQDAVAELAKLDINVDRELKNPVAVNAAVAGWRDEEARLLAERAGYR